MLAFQDFYHKIENPGNWLRADKWQPLQACLEEANVWIDENEVNVVNVETVVLPNVWSEREEGPNDAHLSVYGKGITGWYQIVRVWYQKDSV